MLKKMLLGAGVASLLLQSTVAESFVEVGAWDSELSGELIGAGGNGRGVIRKEDDTSLNLTVRIPFLGGGTTLNYTNVSYDSLITAQAAFRFDGINYALGEQIDLKMDWETWDLNFRGRDFIDWTNAESGRSGGLNLVYGIQAIQADLRLQSRLIAGNNSDFDETIPIPYIGLEGKYPMGSKASLEASFKGFDIEIDSNEAAYYDFQIGVRFAAGKENDSSFFLGYKDRDLDIVANGGDPDEARLDMGMGGFVASYQFRF